MSIPETPYTRLEMYLDEIARNGGGGGGGGGSSSLSGLTDVDISNPTNGQTLVYNATSGKWENGAGGGGASLIMPNVSITMTGAETGTATCDMTRADIVSAIENGAICNAKIACNAWGEGTFQYTSRVIVSPGEYDDDPCVIFIAYELLGGGDIIWSRISVFDDAVECHIERTVSHYT